MQMRQSQGLNIYIVRTVGIAAKDALGVLSSNILNLVQLLWIEANRKQQ